MKTHRIYAGYIEEETMVEWTRQMKADGFKKFWSWVVWIVNQHIKKNNHEQNESVQ